MSPNHRPTSAVMRGLGFASLLLLLAASVSAATKSLRIVSWNLHHGVGEDGKLDLERIAAVIRNATPDLVALQEIDKQCGRSGKVDQPAELAKLTGLIGVFGKAMDFDGGGYGQVILSRYPILRSEVHPLPGNSEPRIAFEATVSIEGSEIQFISVHLGLDSAERLAQAKTLTELAAQDARRSILCGDFNAIPESPPLAALAGIWKAVPKKAPVLTCPAGKPQEEIDHVFARGFPNPSPLIVIPETVASDHRPLLAEITLE
ncbi:MAG: endonuclease/exonuclease/phosphatase family protein [Verrucomicrobiota bacterium]